MAEVLQRVGDRHAGSNFAERPWQLFRLDANGGRAPSSGTVSQAPGPRRGLVRAPIKATCCIQALTIDEFAGDKFGRCNDSPNGVIRGWFRY